MPKEYTCDLCKKQFIQKIDLTRHQNKKTACITLTDMEKIIKEKENTTSQNALSTALKSCLNILRDNEAITGDKALRNISYLLILKLIEPHIGNTIDLENYPFNFSHVEPANVDFHRSKLFSITKFSNLVNEKEVNLTTNIRFLWDDILSMHSATKKVFLFGSGFDIKKESTFKALINKIHNLNLTNISFDILGHAYEDVIQSIMVGKTLGQFFTPVPVKKMMINLINPQMRPDGKFETCGEPAMGTAGFLTSYLQHVLKQAKEKNIQPDWNFIRNEGLYGNEISSDTFQLAMANMLISSGHIFDQMDCGDSIRKMITRKFEVVLANPPFGIKGLKYDSFNYPDKEKYIPFKINNGSMLFLQVIIYILKLNGRCAVVMPDGQELFSNTNAAIIKIRKYLMKTCDLHEVIYLPAQTFTNTAVKTAVLYFTKKRECEQAVKIENKTTKSKTIKKIEFAEDYMTETVKFYNYNPDTEVKTLLGEKSMDEISNHHYTLTFNDTVTKMESNNNNIPTKTLGEICTFQNGFAFKSSDYEKEKKDNNIGIITIKCIQDNEVNKDKISDFVENNDKYNKFIINKNDILISLTGYVGKIGLYKYDEITYLNQRVAKISFNEEINYKYFYYWYINNNIIDILANVAKGTAQLNISIKNIEDISIPVPSLETQQEIIKKFDEKESFLKSYADTIANLKKLIKNNIQRLIGKNPVTKTLGAVCTFMPKSKKAAAYGKETGTYPFFTSSLTVSKFVDEPDYKEECLIIGTGGNANIKYASSFSCSADNVIIKLNDVEKVNVNIQYIYKYLLHNIEILANGFIGLGIKHISKDFIKNISIPIPSLEIQQEIINTGQLIDHLENEFDKVKEDYNKNLKTIFQFDNQINEGKQEESEEENKED